MIVREEILLKINARGKIQEIFLSLDKNPYSGVYTIYNVRRQESGKKIDQPPTIISDSNTRTLEKEANARFITYIKRMMRKGYKWLRTLSKKAYDKLSREDILKLLEGGKTTNTRVQFTPMLPKNVDKLSSEVFNKDWYCYPILSGVRCLVYMSDGNIIFQTLNKKHITNSVSHIRNNKNLNKLFINNPDAILDGVIYCQDYTKKELSASIRSKVDDPNLKLNIEDFVSDQRFTERLEVLDEMKQLFKDDSCITIPDYTKLTGWLQMKTRKNSWILNGFKGLYGKNPKRPYGKNKKSGLYMIEMS